MHHHTWLIFAFLVETKFGNVDQADLELLTSSNSPRLGLPKYWDYRREPLCLAMIRFVIEVRSRHNGGRKEEVISSI